MAIQIKLKNSVVQDSTPSTSDLPAVGEIALNANINSIGGFMRASDNSIVKIFGPGSLSTPTATTTVSGISELATNSETTTGTATNRVVTPAGLNAVTVAERTTSNTNYVAKAGSTMTGVLTATAGSNSAPAINFGDSDSGIFGGTNTVSLAAGGTTRLTADTGVDITGTLAVTGAITSTSDLTIADKIIHAGDTNTAVRFPAADTVSVETGGSEALRVDSSGRLLIGHSSSQTVDSADCSLQVVGSNFSNSGFTQQRFVASVSGPSFIFAKSRSGTIGTQTIVQNGDELGKIRFYGSDGNDFDNYGAEIRANVDGTPGSNDMPGRLVFLTTADGAATPTARLTIDSTGTSTFAGNVDCSAGLDVTGATTGTTSGTDVGLTITQNGTGNILNLYDGGNLVFKVNSVGNPTVTSTNPVFTSTNSSSSVTTTLFSNSSGQGVLQTNTGSDLFFATGAVEKVRITSSGLVGIATSSPAQRLHVYGNSGFTAIAVGDNSTTEPYLLLEADEANNLCSLHSRTNNSLTFKINNSERMRIDTAGRLGLGTSSPDGQLHVFSNSAGSVTAANDANDLVIESTANVGMSFLTANDSLARIKFGDPDDTGIGAIIYSHADNFMQYKVNGSERMRIDSSGRLLIGTTTEGFTSADDLTVANTGNCGITIRSGNTSNGNIYFSDATSGSGEYTGYFEYRHADDSLRIGVNAAEAIAINSSGNLGIGTSSPLSKLNIVDGSDNDVILFVQGADTTSEYVSLGVQTGKAIVRGGGSGSTNTALVFEYSNAGTETEGMRIDSSGRVLIGLNSNAANASIDDLQVGNPNAVTQHGITIGSNDEAAIAFANNGDARAGSITYTMSSDAMIFKTNGQNERMRLDNSGNVGIGTSLPNQILHLNAANPFINIKGTSNSGDTGIFINADANHWLVRADNNTSANTFSIKSGDPSSSTHRLMIFNDGSVLMGPTSTGTTAEGAVIRPGNESTLFRDTGIVALVGGGQSGQKLFDFRHGGTGIGNIKKNGTTGVEFNVSNSDRTLKKNFEDWTETVLTSFKNLNPQKFNFIQEEDTDAKHKGYIAQDLVDKFPEAYPQDPETNKYLYNPSGMVVYLMKAIQELEAKVAALEAA